MKSFVSKKLPVTITLDPDIYEIALKLGEREKRNFSNLCEVSLTEYTRARQEDPRTAELLAAVEQAGGVDVVLEAIRRIPRPRKNPKARRIA
jgi:hypothetical protein